MNRREMISRLAAGVLGAPVLGRMSLADTPFEAIPGATLNKDQRNLLELLDRDFVAVEINQEKNHRGHPTTWVTYARKEECTVGLDDVAYDLTRHATPAEFQVNVSPVEEIDVTLLGCPGHRMRWGCTVKVRYVG